MNWRVAEKDTSGETTLHPVKKETSLWMQPTLKILPQSPKVLSAGRNRSLFGNTIYPIGVQGRYFNKQPASVYSTPSLVVAEFP